MKEDIEAINDLLSKMNFKIHNLEKVTYFEKPEWENYTDAINKGWWTIQKACNALYDLINNESEK